MGAKTMTAAEARRFVFSNVLSKHLNVRNDVWPKRFVLWTFTNRSVRVLHFQPSCRRRRRSPLL